MSTHVQQVTKADGSSIMVIIRATEPGFDLSIMDAAGEQAVIELDANEASALATIIAQATF